MSVSLLAGARATADEIQTVTRARYVSVRIEDVQDGKLVFRDVQGRVAERALAEVGTLSITGWEAFNRAEASLSAKQYRQAVREFDAVLRDVEQAGPDAGRPKHRRDLLLARLLLACDGEGRFDRAVECYISLCKVWGAGAAGLEPRNVPPKESAFYTAATERLAAAVTEAGQTPAGERLREYQTRLTRPAESPGPGLTSRPATQPAGKPLATKSVRKPAERSPERRREADPRLAQVAKWVEAGETERALKLVDDALRTAPTEGLGTWYYWQGRCIEASAKDDATRLRAALAYVRVPVHYAGDPLCAECLYRAAMIHIQTGHADRAPGLLREALRHSPGEDLKRKCEAALAGG